MRSRTALIMLLCLIGITILVAGCTTQQGEPVTTPQTTVPVTATLPGETATITRTATVTETGIPETTLTTGSPAVSPTEDQGVRVKIRAENFAFDLSTIAVPAGSQVIVEFENKDRAPHNVAFYTTPSATTILYRGDIITGPTEITYRFIAPATPGTYFFRCDVHPSMQGQFVVT